MMSEDGPKLPKHHYIPVLYLKQWTVDGRLIEFSRPFSRVEPRPTAPKGTGYKRGVYRLRQSAGEVAEFVEREFMAQVDNLAKDALDLHLGSEPHPTWTLKTRSAWSRFINAFMFRVPERVAEAKKALEDYWLDNYEKRFAEYNRIKKPGDPEFIDFMIRAIDRGTLDAVMAQIDSQRIGTLLNSMRWFTLSVKKSGRTLFTSDRPIIMTNGLAYPHSHLVMPISPTRLFAATNTEEEENKLRSIPQRELAKHANRHVVRRAQSYVWHQNTGELEFVRKHMSEEADIDRDFFLNPPASGSQPRPSRLLSRS